MKKALYISIKPQFTKLIETGEKNYEFRKYIPKKEFDTLFVYETVPTCALKYIIDIDEIVEYPNKIDEKGYGNLDFNNGLKKSKYAYHIKGVKKLVKPIPLKLLKEEYEFAAPQSYAYDDRYMKLTNDILNADFIKLV